MNIYFPQIMSDAPRITDRKALEMHRARARRVPVLFLHEDAAVETEERLSEVNKSFKSAAFVGNVTKPFRSIFPSAPVLADTDRLSVDQKAHDVLLHLFGLHWADDPIGQMVQSRLALKPDGLFLAIMFGGGTLQELRAAIAETEARLTGGLSPRVLPMADLRDLGGLLQRAGFALPVADSRKLTVRYSNLAALVQDLRGMGETNALAARHKRQVPRHFFPTVEKVYRANFADDGYLVATFEIIFLTGWAPAVNQPEPLRPGSAKTRLADVLNVREHPLDRS